MSSAQPRVCVEPTSPARSVREAIDRLQPLKSTLPFVLLITFVLFHFLRFSARNPAIGMMRPSLVLTGLLTIVLLLHREHLEGRLSGGPARALKWLMLWILLSLPFVEWPGSVVKYSLETWILSLTFFYFTALIVDSVPRLRKFVAVFVCCQVFRVLEPLYLNITQGYWGDKTHLGGGEFMDRLGGSPYDVVNPNGLGFVIVTAVVFIYFLWLRPKGTSWATRLLWIVVVGAMLYALVLTSSRSGMLALLVAIVGIIIKSKRRLLLTGIIVGGSILAFGSMGELHRDRYLSLVSSSAKGSATAQGRMRGLEHEFGLAFHNPVFGFGLGRSAEAKANVLGDAQVAHNLYTEVAIDLGIPGLVIFLLFIRAAYLSVANLRREIEKMVGSTPDARYLADLADAIQVWTFMCLFISLAYFGLMEWHWYLVCGLALASTRLVPTLQLASDPPGKKKR